MIDGQLDGINPSLHDHITQTPRLNPDSSFSRCIFPLIHLSSSSLEPLAMTEPASLLRLTLPSLPTFDLPPRLPVTDPELERQVFTHSSYHARPRKATSLDMDDDQLLDNEKLEHVGDSLLGSYRSTRWSRLRLMGPRSSRHDSSPQAVPKSQGWSGNGASMNSR